MSKVGVCAVNEFFEFGSFGSFARPVPDTPLQFEIVHANGRCSPATARNLKRALKQERSNELKLKRQWRKDRMVKIEAERDNISAARRLLRELAEHDRESRKYAAVLRGKVKAPPRHVENRGLEQSARMPLPSRATRSNRPSSWIVDDRRMRGVIYRQSYIRRGTKGFFDGCARDHYYYTIRDEAVVIGTDGLPIVVTNMGDTIDEVAAGWDAIEQATTRRNGKVQIRIVLPQDADASMDEMVSAIRIFCKTALEPLGIPYSGVLHQPSPEGDDRNWHAHVLVHLRSVERIAPYTWAFADEMRGELDGAVGVGVLRHLWADAATEAARAAGREQVYTGLSYIDRKLPLESGEHLGPMLTAIVRRGDRVPIAERNALRRARNNTQLRLRDFNHKIAALEAIKASVVRSPSMPVWPTGNPVRQPIPSYAAKSAPITEPSPAWVPADVRVTVPSTWPNAKTSAADIVSPWVAAVRNTAPVSMPRYASAAGPQRDLLGQWTARRNDTISVSPAVPVRWSKCATTSAILPSYASRPVTSSTIAIGWKSRERQIVDVSLKLAPWAPASVYTRSSIAAWTKPKPPIEVPDLNAGLEAQLSAWRDYIERVERAEDEARAKTNATKGGRMRLDGFGGLTDEAERPHVPPAARTAPIAAFVDEKPTNALLDFAFWVAQNPYAITIATDRKITVAVDADDHVRQCIDRWRDDPDASVLLKDVVKRARHDPDRKWPPSIDTEMRLRLRSAKNDNRTPAQLVAAPSPER
jgi:hypothetical protein